VTDSPATRTPLWRALVAELLGTALLVATVVGSGIAAQRLSPTDTGLQLLENSIATALVLAVLIAVLMGVSGAHFNPAVTLASAALDGPAARLSAVIGFIAAQIVGAFAGALLANAMFGVAPGIATTERVTPGTLLGEVVATAGLIIVIVVLVRTGRATALPLAVAGWIGAAYWFTSSTSFANPAVTLGRMITDTFAGITPASAGWFILAQLVGAGLGLGIAVLLAPRPQS
jgi:glycerol uptake facilitator-like aquaporin